MINAMDQALAFIIGFVASLIGAIASGGGLVSVPGMLSLGLTPVSAIATTRLNIVAGGLTASWRYYRDKDIKFHFLPYFLILALLAGIVGPKLLLSLPQEAAQDAIGVALLISIPLLLLDRDFGLKTQSETMWRKVIGLAVMSIILVYCTAFAAGGGILMAMALVYFFGLNFTQANATGVVVNWCATTVALVTYIHGGAVNWYLGVPSLVGALIGGYIGAGLAIKRGVHWVRLVLIVVVAAFGVKLLFF